MNKNEYLNIHFQTRDSSLKKFEARFHFLHSRASFDTNKYLQKMRAILIGLVGVAVGGA